MKKATCVFAGAVLMFLTLSVSAWGAFKGNWTETFFIKEGHYVRHTPTYVTIDDMFTVGNGIHMRSLVINGTEFKNVHLDTDSTREEFVAAMHKAKMFNE